MKSILGVVLALLLAVWTRSAQNQPSTRVFHLSEASNAKLASSSVPSAAEPLLRYVAGSTVKVEQLLGEEDKQLRQPTLSRTVTRYGIEGTDLGNSFEHGGRVYFLFGDTVGRLRRALDTIATTDAEDPESGVRLDFLKSGSDYLTIQPPGISMGAFEVPVAGISLGGQVYVIVSTNHSEDRSTDRSVLTKFTPPENFQPLRTIPQLPEGHFVKMSLHIAPGTIAGLPPAGPFVLVWGTGAYRKSDAYCPSCQRHNLKVGKGQGISQDWTKGSAPIWSEKESEARAIVENGTMGDLSVTWCKDLGLWLMTYDSREPDNSKNVVHVAVWEVLEPAQQAQFTELFGQGQTGKQAFDETIYHWVFTHELGHWWQACEHKTDANHYSEDMGRAVLLPRIGG